MPCVLQCGVFLGVGQNVGSYDSFKAVCQWLHDALKAEPFSFAQAVNPCSLCFYLGQKLRFLALRFAALPGRYLACGFKQQGLQVARELIEAFATDGKNVRQIGVFAQGQITLDFMNAHAVNGNQGVFLAIHYAIQQRLACFMEVYRDRLCPHQVELITQQAALHDADIKTGKILRRTERLVGGKVFETITPKGNANHIDFIHFFKKKSAGFSVENGIQRLACRQQERQVGILHFGQCGAELCRWNQQEIQLAAPCHFQHLVIVAKHLVREQVDPQASLGMLLYPFLETCSGEMECAALRDVVAEPEYQLIRGGCLVGLLYVSTLPERPEYEQHQGKHQQGQDQQGQVAIHISARVCSEFTIADFILQTLRQISLRTKFCLTIHNTFQVLLVRLERCFNPVAPIVPRRIDSLVGTTQRRVHLVILCSDQGNADTGGDLQCIQIRKGDLRNGKAQSFRQYFSPRQVSTRQQYGKLLSANAANNIDLAQPGSGCVRKGFQHPVTGGMTKTVINLFEVIQVDHHQSAASIEAFGSGPLLLHPLHEVTPVGQPGQCVTGRQAVQLLLSQFLRCNILHHAGST